jgi:hypothetical protein
MSEIEKLQNEVTRQNKVIIDLMDLTRNITQEFIKHQYATLELGQIVKTQFKMLLIWNVILTGIISVLISVVIREVIK